MSWQPIETAPKDGTDILVVNADGMTTAHWLPYSTSNDGCWNLCQMGDFATGGQLFPDPTHWQPLPDPPP